MTVPVGSDHERRTDPTPANRWLFDPALRTESRNSLPESPLGIDPPAVPSGLCCRAVAVPDLCPDGRDDPSLGAGPNHRSKSPCLHLLHHGPTALAGEPKYPCS